MNFYDLTKKERETLSNQILTEIKFDIDNNGMVHCIKYFSDSDTYIRKVAYAAVGKIYKSDNIKVKSIIEILDELIKHDNELIRQTVINAVGEIGIYLFDNVEHLLETGLKDKHHKVKNAVIGSLKRIGEKNPKSMIKFAEKYIHHPDAEIRRQICHGLELRGRLHPDEVLPLLEEFQDDKSKRVQNMLIHVIGQISYKKGCFEKVVNEVITWKNESVIKKSLAEIVEVHRSYEKFSAKQINEVENYINLIKI